MPTETERIHRLTDLLASSRRPVFLTGAGMSTESGIPDFRSAGGLYRNGVGEDVFDIRAFNRNPERFYGFSQRFLGLIRAARPHPGHLAIAALAHEFGRRVTVVTQNIDMLHQEAGSPVVLPVHGTLASSHCTRCGATIATEQVWAAVERGELPRHDVLCNGIVKPDIVFFGELLPPDIFAAAETAVREADLLVVAGTSLIVFPAASLPTLRRPECPLVIINQSPTTLDGSAHLLFREPAGKVLDQAVARLRSLPGNR